MPVGHGGVSFQSNIRRKILILAIVLVAAAFAGILRIPTAAARQGPIEACGYQWTDSDPGGGEPKVPYDWVEIQPTGTLITDWAYNYSDDGWAGPFALGFDFTFYDLAYPDVYVDTNGYVSFGAGWSDIPWESIPSANPPNNFAMAFGADLVPGNAIAPDGVYYQQLTTPNRFVVEFVNVPHYVSPPDPSFDPVTFEVILYDTGEIWFQYNTVAGEVYAVGIENGDGSAGVNYDPASVSNSDAIRFMSVVAAPGPYGVSLSPCAQSVSTVPGSAVDASLNVTNLGTAAPNDTFEMTYASPSGWNATFYDADGVTPLADTNGDTNPDTGPLNASGGWRDILLRVEVPSGFLGIELINVTATSVGDSLVSATSLVSVSIAKGAFTPPHSDYGWDTDGDGQFNYLVVDANVTIGEYSAFHVDAYLHDPGWILNLYASADMYLDPGAYTISLYFQGERINASGVDGPYYVDMNLYDAWSGWWLDSDTYATAVHSHLQFESPRAAFYPPHSDYGYDSDGDGQYNYLNVAVNVTVDNTNWYSINAYLRDANYSFSIYAYWSGYLYPGFVTITLSFDGSRINASGVDGPYLVELNLYDWELLDFEVHTTAAYSHLQFETPRAAFYPPHYDYGYDADSDGQFDYLNVAVNVTVDTSNWYSLSSSLRDANYSFSIYAYWSGYLDPGVSTLTLSFDGPRINGSGVDGPYIVDLYLYDWDFLDSDTHMTSAYSHLQFEPPRAVLAPPHADSGIDIDGDTLYDFLVVDVRVQVNTAGYYQAQGTLHDAGGYLWLYASTYVYLDAGIQTMRLSYSGVSIYWSGVNGPYYVEIYLYDTFGNNIDYDQHVTAAYTYTQFDSSPPAEGAFYPPHADHGVDSDGDGSFDYLVVDVNLAIGQSYYFRVVGVLHDPSYSLYVYAEAYYWLNPGLQVVQLSFDGVAINRSDIDGPYTVDLTLYNWYYGYFLDSDTYTTSAYSHWDFDGPPGRFVPPHSDVGVDTDADGLYNYLAVDVNVATDYAGVFLTMAYLYVPGGGGNGTGNESLSLWAQNLSYLPGGPVTMRFLFNGYRINASGFDGPYTIQLYLYDAYAGLFLDNDTYLTSAYLHTEFEEIPAAQSGYTSAAPTIDGVYSPGEWADALEVDLAATPGNPLNGSLLIMDDNVFLYVAYDVTGDTTADAYDGASIAFDTGNDAIATDGREDEFIQAGGVPGSQAHAVYSAAYLSWTIEDAPYNTSLPNHQGLASARGFGRSDRDSTYHRIYEFAIPFALLGLQASDTIGFFGGSHFYPGVYDYSRGLYDAWPDNSGPLPLNAYADLNLAPDLTRPTVSIDSPASGTLFGVGSVTVTWTAADVGLGLDHFEVSVDGGAPAIVPGDQTSYTVTGLSDGTRTIRVTAFDAAGNSRSASVDVVVDTTPPTVAVSAPTPGAVLAVGTVTLMWTASDAVSGVDHIEVTQDGSLKVGLPATATTFTYTSVSDGPHTFTVTAFDVAGHSRTVSVNVIVDTIDPTLSVLTPAPGALLGSSSVTVTWTAADSGSGVEHIVVVLDAGTPITLPAGTTSYTFTALADGDHTVALTAVDLAGNSVSGSRTFRVDTTPPALTIDSPADQAVIGLSTVAATWTSADATSAIDHFEVSLDGGTAIVLAPGVTSYAFTGVADGTHTIQVATFDIAGNSRSASVGVIVDTIAPTFSISDPASGAYEGASTFQVLWTASDASSGIDHFTLSLDGGSAVQIAGTSTSYTSSSVAEGIHSLTMTAFDRAGHSRIDSVSFTVDATNPTVSISSPAAGAYLDTDRVTVTWTAGDTVSGLSAMEIALDGGTAVPLSAGTRSYAFATVADGTHTVAVTAIDWAGHTQSSTVSVVVDTTTPSLSITSPSSGSIVTTSGVTVTWTSSDATSGIDRIEVTLDGGAAVSVAATATSHTFDGVADGTHTIKVTVVDRAGNAVEQTLSIRVDTAILSPNGPFGVIPLTAIIVAIAAAIVATLLILRRRKRPQPPQPPEANP